jgi:GTP-binding protein HflX
MLDSQQSLLPVSPDPHRPLEVLTIGSSQESLDELDRLLTTLGVKTAARIEVVLRKINPATYVGSGKLEEVQQLLLSAKVDAVILDFDLTPNQLKNVEKLLGKSTVDRPGVIIEIFSRHARTKEAKVQVELARLEYLLPRLAHYWSHFERQRGGLYNKGMGEKQIEVDRRLVRKRMQILSGRLKEIENERSVRRQGRREVLKVAIVGYTNAGKSTLLNALTHSGVLAEDKLFATLDASIRSLDPHSHPPVVAIDTVGFISNLPHSLVASFRSTLEELRDADLLLHVVDGSSDQAREQYEVTEKVLEELELQDKPRLVVLNKSDLLEGTAARNRARVISPGAITVSAMNLEEVKKLRDRILEHFRKGLEVWEIVVPYTESRMEALIHAHAVVDITRHLEKGTFYKIRIEAGWAKKLDLGRFKT